MMCNTLSCQKLSYKTLLSFLCRPTSNYPIHSKKPSSPPEFDFESTYMSEFDPPGKLVYLIMVSMSTERELTFDETYLSNTNFLAKL